MGSELGITSDSKPELTFDALGIFYSGFAVAWTVILIGGMAFLWLRRDMPILRIRGLPLSFAAITFMHTYWITAQLNYIYRGLVPEAVEYWVMGIWLPFGIALFHASNSRFLYVANAQRKFLKKADTPVQPVSRKNLLGRWSQLDYTYRMLLVVFSGMGLHLVLIIFMFLISRKFHDSFGIPGTEVHGDFMERRVAQGRGWEWWPSVFWQIFWAWVVAPCILWRSRKLRDTQGWRFQTIACCLSSLHSAPMWLIALYIPAMESINLYFIPPQWICVSIILLEIFTVFVPAMEVCKHQSLTKETLKSIAFWETRKKAFGGGRKSLVSESSASSISSWIGRMGRASSVYTSSGSSILTMDALEHTLAKNPKPLQFFSALRDFSGENIAFLTRVKEWKRTYFPPDKELKKAGSVTKILPRECFEHALRIYIEFISATHAEFQINLSSSDFKNLKAIFERASRIICGVECNSPDPATPFNDIHKTESESTFDVVHYLGEVPENFSGAVFDNAEGSIKYLVLTNTWPKFVKERQSIDSVSLDGAGC